MRSEIYTENDNFSNRSRTIQMQFRVRILIARPDPPRNQAAACSKSGCIWNCVHNFGCSLQDAFSETPSNDSRSADPENVFKWHPLRYTFPCCVRQIIRRHRYGSKHSVKRKAIKIQSALDLGYTS